MARRKGGRDPAMPEGVRGAVVSSPLQPNVKTSSVTLDLQLRPTRYPDPWSGESYIAQVQNNQNRIQGIVFPYAPYQTGLQKLSLNGTFQNRPEASIIAQYWLNLYRLMVNKVQASGKRVISQQLVDPLQAEIVLEWWLTGMVILYGVMSWLKTPSVLNGPILNQGFFAQRAGAEAKLQYLWNVFSTFPVPQGIADMAWYYGSGVQASPTSPVCIGTVLQSSAAARLDWGQCMQGTNDDLLTQVSDILIELTNSNDRNAFWATASQLWPIPSLKPAINRIDPEAVANLLQAPLTHTAAGVAWTSNPRLERVNRAALLVVGSHKGFCPYAFTLYRPEWWFESAANAEPAASLGGPFGITAYADVAADSESHLIVITGQTALPTGWEVIVPDQLVPTSNIVSPFMQFLYGPATVDDLEMNADEVESLWPLCTTLIAEIDERSIVLNTLEMLRKWFGVG